MPWYASRVVSASGNHALRPVREDEVEELDDVPPGSDWVSPPGPQIVRPSLDAHRGAVLVAEAMGRALRADRWAMHLSQTVYARRSGRAQGTVSKLERGGVPLSIQELFELAFETGRSIRIDVVLDRTTRDPAQDHVSSLPLGAHGYVGVSVGRRVRGRGTDGHRFGPIS